MKQLLLLLLVGGLVAQPQRTTQSEVLDNAAGVPTQSSVEAIPVERTADSLLLDAQQSVAEPGRTAQLVDTIRVIDTVYIQVVPKPSAVPTLAQEEYERDSLAAEDVVEPWHFLAQNSDESVDKGRGYVGGTFSFSRNGGENYEILGLIPVEQNDVNSFGISLIGGYLFKRHFSVGAGLAYEYKKSHFKGNDTVDVNAISVGYAVVPHIRNYIPLPKRSFLQVFNQTNLGFSYISGLEEDNNGNSLDRWGTKAFEFEVGIQPGVSVFAGKGVTIEAAIDVLGFKMTRTEYEKNGEYQGYHNKSDLSFKLNLLALSLGITVYI